MNFRRELRRKQSKRIIGILLMAVTVFSFSLTTQAQVTIGSGLAPTRAALLDLKEQQTSNPESITDTESVTSGGLLLPRVKLISANTLQPFIDVTDPEWTNAAQQKKLRLSLIGLMIYNITDDGSFYPAVYTWNGTIWSTSQANEIASSITKQPKKFTFYEQGIETTESTDSIKKVVPLEFEVNGLGTWKYQWYQVMGSNVHVRIGEPVGKPNAGTVYSSVALAQAAGSNSSSFIPGNYTIPGTNAPGILKGTTRNANYTGFYRFYCVATNEDYGTVLTSDIAEVAVGCGAKNNAGEWLSFMCFNLGATKLTIKDQMDYPMLPPVNQSSGLHTYVEGEENLYGDLYQWGRIGDGHEKRGVSAGFIPGQNTAGTNQIAYNAASPPIFESGNIVGSGIQQYPWFQISPSDNTYYGKFITVNTTHNQNWAYGVSASDIDRLWRSGIFHPNDPCAKIKEDGVTYVTYYPAATTDTNVGHSGTGWRTPSHNEWGDIFKGSSISGPSGTSTANTWRLSMTNGRGFQIQPDGETTTLFLSMTGFRHYNNGLLYYQGTFGYYWSTSSDATTSLRLDFSTNSAMLVNISNSTARGNGHAIRCIKN